MRQHVNPLSRYFQLPLKLPNPSDLFENYDQPIHLDIGSARGKFLLGMALMNPEWNHLGLEIRRPLVALADSDCTQLGLANLRFLFCNVNVSLHEWLLDLPNDLLQKVSIQFPDPWFKRRHYKRRVLQPELLIALANALQPGRELYLQSDLLDVIQPMVKLVEMSGCFNSFGDGRWLDRSLFPVQTERENYVLGQGLRVYRAIYYRNKNKVPELIVLEEKYKALDCLKKRILPFKTLDE